MTLTLSSGACFCCCGFLDIESCFGCFFAVTSHCGYLPFTMFVSKGLQTKKQDHLL